jgi:hypothetical protein
MTSEDREVIEQVAVVKNQRLAEVNSSIELKKKEDFGTASEEHDVTARAPPPHRTFRSGCWRAAA